MRHLILAIAASGALLAACSRSETSREDPSAAPTTTPAIAACNSVTPDAARQVAVEDGAAIAVAASDLRGGSISPGLYDLTAASRIGAATGWTGTRAVALEVSEAADGQVAFNWAGAAPSGDADRWSASFSETPQPRLTYSCGRIGDVPLEFSAETTVLTLRLQDGAGGQLALTFSRRS